MKPLRVIHIITGLGTGGAEMSLLRLLSVLDRDRFDPYVISLTNGGAMSEKITQLGIPVRFLGVDAHRPNIFLFFRLVVWLREIHPDVIQTWMYHADLLGGLAGFFIKVPVIWAIHNSTTDPQHTRKRTLLVIRVCAFLSRLIPIKIVSCSEKARQIHVDAGYASEKFVIIPNGFDLSHFKPKNGAAKILRRQLEIDPAATLIGMAARYDPQKDHVNFIRAAQIFHRISPQTYFLLCGEGLTWQNTPLVAEIDSTGLCSHFHLLGRRDDMPSIFTALDLHTLSSAYGEAFPNVLGEAMACGVPCVATDVGDTAYLISDTGIVVPPKDPQALADGWERLLCMNPAERRKLGEQARRRIQQHFSISQIVQQYQALYEQVVRDKK